MTAALPGPQFPADALARLWADSGMPVEALNHVVLTGTEPVLPSSFAVGTVAQVSVAAAALAAATLHHEAGGRVQAVAVDMRHAAVEFRSERLHRIDGQKPPELWDALAGIYPTKDGGWVRLHTNFSHHRANVLQLLGCEPNRAAVAAALLKWDATAFETTATAGDMVVAAYRSLAEWQAHPHAREVETVPLVQITRTGNAPMEPLRRGDRPLSGMRVLDLTRVIAGPVCGRTLAAHGADVLLITSPKLPNLDDLIVDTGRGKLSAQLDLTQGADRATLYDLLAEADIFVQGYRPGGIAAKGLSPEQAARIRPGIIYGTISAYGSMGPWSQKRGFDSLVQTATGLNAEEAAAARQSEPKPLPAQALDHASGYLLAFGILAALRRRTIEGGSWHVQVSLVRTAHWLRSLGRIAGGLDCPELENYDEFLEFSDFAAGKLRATRHSAKLSVTPARWNRPSVPTGTHPPVWPARS